MTSISITRRAAALGLAAAAAIAVTAGAARAEDVIRVERAPVGAFQGLYLAEQLGLFKERGLKVEINVGASPDGALAQLMAGQKDVAMTGLVPLTAAVANGLPVAAVLNAQDQNEVRTFGLLVKPGATYKSVADLKGKKIGLPGIASPQGTALLMEMEKHGLTRNDIELVNLPFPGVLAAIESGTVDAGMPVGLFYTLGIKQGYGEIKEVFDHLVSGTPAIFYASNKQWADSNKEVLGKFIEAMSLAHEYGNKNPDKIREIDAAQTQMPPDFIKTREIAPFESSFDPARWNIQNEQLKKFEFISRIPAPDEYIWSGAPKR
jgi:NitT/TauT family transport system substrate-binding protein